MVVAVVLTRATRRTMHLKKINVFFVFIVYRIFIFILKNQCLGEDILLLLKLEIK